MLILFSLLKNIKKLNKLFISELLMFKFIQIKFDLKNINIIIIKKIIIIILVLVFIDIKNNSLDAILDT